MLLVVFFCEARFDFRLDFIKHVLSIFIKAKSHQVLFDHLVRDFEVIHVVYEFLYLPLLELD